MIHRSLIRFEHFSDSILLEVVLGDLEPNLLSVKILKRGFFNNN